MGKIGSIKIKSIDELRATTIETNSAPATTTITANATISFIVVDSDSMDDFAIEAPETKKKTKPKAAATTSKKTLKVKPPNTPEKTELLATNKKSVRTAKKEPPPNQTRIDSFFRSGTKSYIIKPESSTPNKLNSTQKQQHQSSTKKSSVRGRRGAAAKKGRKRLFEDETETESTTSGSCFGDMTPPRSSRKRRAGTAAGAKKSNKKAKKTPVKAKKQQKQEEECIDLCSDTEDEGETTLKFMEEAIRLELRKAEQNVKRENVNLEVAGGRMENIEVEQGNSNEEREQVDKIGAEDENGKPHDDVSSTNAATDQDQRQSEVEMDKNIEELPDHQDQVMEMVEDEESRKTAADKETKKDTNKQLNKESGEQTQESSKDNEENVGKNDFLAPKKAFDDVSTAAQWQATPTINSQESLMTPLRDSDGKIKVREENSLELLSQVSGTNITTTTTTTSSATNLTLKGDDIIEIDLTENDDNEVSVETCSVTSSSNNNGKSRETSNKTNGIMTRSRKQHACPPYKKIVGTTFAVDAFRYGQIEGVTHYFLTHFHADHYIGLTRKFAMPLYLSAMTARLLRVFIPVEEQYIHEMEMYKPQIIEGVEVTAIDANHCPGAAMFVFKLPDGKCILHTGDFRACADMESEPIFWNNDIHTIYLDTTYLSDKYSFCTQYESIDVAKNVVRKFQAKNAGKRILYVCGSYLVGKEKFWSALATEFKLTIWAQENRRKALDAMECEDLQNLLRDKPEEANFHIVPLGNLNFWSMVDYFNNYAKQYDTMLAFRPSGWEKNSKPQYRGTVNIVGIEYSEHSSHNELKRFVMFLKPQEVISTVPHGRDPMRTPEVPQRWYKYHSLSAMQRNFQPSITSYLKLNKRKSGSQAPENLNCKELIKKKQARVAATATATAVVEEVECIPPKSKSTVCDEKQTKYQKMPLADNVQHSPEKMPMTPKSSPLSLLGCTQDAMAGSEALSPAKINENLKYFGDEDAFDDWLS